MITSWIDNCGKLIYFGASNGSQYCSVTNINNNPTISVDGNTVPTSSGMFFSTNKDTPWVAYQLLCGKVQGVGLQNAGFNISNPSVTCSGVKFGSPIITTGITNYIVHNPGNALTSTPSISSPYGKLKSTVVSGQLTQVYPQADNILGRWQIPAGSPTTVSVNVGQGCAVIPNVVSGVIKSIAIPGTWGQNNGRNYPNSISVNIWDNTGSGAVASAYCQDGWVYNVTVISGGTNYSNNPVITLAPPGNPISIEGVVEPYLQYVPVIDSEFFYNQPTIICSDPLGSGVSLIPIMGGVTSNNIVTYSASPGWLTANNISVTGESNTHVDNWQGKQENSSPFNIPSYTGYIKIGVNYGEQPIYPGFPNSPLQNKFLSALNWSVTNGGTLTSNTGNAISWTNPQVCSIYRWVYGPNTNNDIDSSGPPNQTGPWLLMYDDPQANTRMGTCVVLGGGGSVANRTILNLSGPNIGTTSGITIDPKDIKLNNGGVSVSLKYSQLGSGYEAALIVINGGGGSQASMVPVITSGIIISLPTVQWGQNYTSTPTINVYGLGKTNNTISGIFNFSYKDNPSSRSLDVSISVAQVSGLYLIQNPYITSPNPYTLEVQPPDRNNRLATDISVLTGLSGINHIRSMDITQGYAGISNEVDESDLLNSSLDFWNINQSKGATFQYCRYFNTDPSNTGYAWCSTKVYGTQSIYCDGQDSFGNYKNLPPNDNGLFTGNYGNWPCVVFQLRSIKPHNLKTGQIAWIGSNTNANSIPITNGTNVSAGFYSVVWVTDPYTAVFNAYVAGNINSNAPRTNPPQTVNSNNEINLVISGVSNGWGVSVTTPWNNQCVPYDYTDNIANDLNCANWINIPAAYSSGLIIGMAKQLQKSKKVKVEYSNEIWNGGNSLIQFIQSWNNLLGYIPTGSSYGKYYVSNGHRPQFDVYGASLILAAEAWDLLEDNMNVAPENFRRVIGSWYGGGRYRTGQIIENTLAWGIKFDELAIAPYYDFPGDNTINSMMTPFGVKNAGGLPPDACNSLIRHYMMYNSSHISNWNGHQQALSYMGQPVNMTNLTELSTSGGHLPSNYYTSYCTFVDPSGLETTVGLSQSFYVNCTNSGWILGVTLPALPQWASTLNLYLSNCPPCTPILYQQFPKGSYVPGNVIALTGAWPAVSINPPTVNHCSGYITNIPDLTTYEGCIEQTYPNYLPFAPQMQHDCFADPSNSLLIDNWYRNCAYRGAKEATFYQAFGFPYAWIMSTSTSQKAGKGDNNYYSISNYPADGKDHNDVNDSTALYGLRQLIGNPTPPTNASIMNYIWNLPIANYFRHRR